MNRSGPAVSDWLLKASGLFLWALEREDIEIYRYVAVSYNEDMYLCALASAMPNRGGRYFGGDFTKLAKRAYAPRMLM